MARFRVGLCWGVGGEATGKALAGTQERSLVSTLTSQTNWEVADARQLHRGDVKGSGEEVEEGGTGWGEFYDRFGERDVGADDGQDVVLLAASAAPGGEDAVKDTFLIALALNGLER